MWSDKCKMVKHFNLLLLIFISLIQVSCGNSVDVIKNKRGAIAGIVHTSDKLNDGSKSNILLLNTELGCATGKDGKFLLLDIPIGVYNIRASSLRFHRSEYYNVRVAEDSVTILRFDLIPDILQIEPIPRFWEEKYKEIFELKDFIIQGKLFDLE
jgi:hypothetical protein